MINTCKFSIIIAFLFTVGSTPAYAIETPVGNIVLPYVENQNDTEPEKKNARRESNQPASASLPAVLPTATPTVIPVPEPVQTAPTPTQTPNPQNKDNDDDEDNNELPLLVPPGGIKPPKDKDRLDNRDEEKETAGIIDTTSTNTLSNQLMPLGMVAESNTVSAPNSSKTNEEISSPVAIIEEIIAPPLASLMKVKGMNYYKSEALPQATTNLLLFLAFLLFVSGAVILKTPSIRRVLTGMKAKIRDKDPFSLPHLRTQ